jgi:7-dehydrocholesterol reductase
VHGQFFYDFWMGVELNPRIGDFDLKMFSIGRIGMIGWAVVLLSHAAKQYQLYGQLSNSMMLLLILQMIYILDWYPPYFLLIYLLILIFLNIYF